MRRARGCSCRVHFCSNSSLSPYLHIFSSLLCSPVWTWFACSDIAIPTRFTLFASYYLILVVRVSTRVALCPSNGLILARHDTILHMRAVRMTLGPLATLAFRHVLQILWTEYWRCTDRKWTIGHAGAVLSLLTHKVFGGCEGRYWSKTMYFADIKENHNLETAQAAFQAFRLQNVFVAFRLLLQICRCNDLRTYACN